MRSSDLRPEPALDKFSTWKHWIFELAERRDNLQIRIAALKMYPEFYGVNDNRDQRDSNDLSQSYDPEIDIVLGDVSASQMESGSIGVTKVDNDVERIILGDEKSDSMLLDKGIQSSGVREDSLQGKEERENDERSR